MHDYTSTISVQALKDAYYVELDNVFGYLQATRRLDRAYDALTRSKDYTITPVSQVPPTFAITGPNDTYIVNPLEQSCTCPDTEKLCKHRYMIRLIAHALACDRHQEV